MSNFAESISPDLEPDFFPGYEGRRLKAAFALGILWSGTAFLHVVHWGAWAVDGFTVLLGLYLMRLMLVAPGAQGASLSSDGQTPEVGHDVEAIDTLPSSPNSVTVTAGQVPFSSETLPYVSILVAAKNEEVVIENLVASLAQLDYPQDRFDFWVIDDNSTDQTGKILDGLVLQYPQLRVVHRNADATGGKSGALNLVWPRTQGDVLVVFDADAQVSVDLLHRVVPFFEQSALGAIQVRKAIANAGANFWTLGQQAEMALDAYFQQQRVAFGGIGELRGNGQFVRRSAIADCGGWNEETITDDLDLTLQLHLQGWNIGFVNAPAVKEEGVTRGLALWHQRNRWAEGGYQRYLDYWRLFTRNRLGKRKLVDLFVFWVLQYMMPMVALPDFVFAIANHRLPIFSPLTTLLLGISFWGMFSGIRRTQSVSIPLACWQTLRGIVYMLHWMVVMSTTTARIAVRPKRLKWVKTSREQEVVA